MKECPKIYSEKDERMGLLMLKGVVFVKAPYKL